MTTRERIGSLEMQVDNLRSQLEFAKGEVREWQEIAASRRRMIEQLSICRDDPDLRVLSDNLNRCRKALAAYGNVMGLIKAQIRELDKWEEER